MVIQRVQSNDELFKGESIGQTQLPQLCDCEHTCVADLDWSVVAFGSCYRALLITHFPSSYLDFI